MRLGRVKPLILFLLRLTTALSLVPTPQNGLTSNSNYFLITNGTNILNFSVEILVEADLHANSNGSSFQLNCLTPLTSGDEVIYQQFVIQNVPGHSTYAAVATFSGFSLADFVFWDDRQAPFPPLRNNTIPAGSYFKISVINDPAGLVIGGHFEWEIQGLGPKFVDTILINNTNLLNHNVTLHDLSPITACTFDIVGSGNWAYGNFSAGQGTLQYSARSPLRPVNTPLGGFPDLGTGETSNAVYSPMANTSARILYQRWSTGKGSLASMKTR